MQTVTFLDQTLTPSKVVCVGRNYVAHIEELGNEMPESMVLFCKPNSAVTRKLRHFTPHTRFEGEICLLMGEAGRVAGVGFGFDLTHAHIQQYLKTKGLPWERAKAFDGSAVFTAFVSAPKNFECLGFRLWQNDTLVQEAHTGLMIHKPPAIIKEIQSFMRLLPGDIVMTGTPRGVGTYEKGDRFRVALFDGDAILIEKEWTVI
jgi:2-keto-4-pentenoate hydratase/2-oxohepta-3-ene-1,7-dioic acid hydratase in catechol pathway